MLYVSAPKMVILKQNTRMCIKWKVVFKTTDLKEIWIQCSVKLVFFDIKNMYTNIPTNTFIHIISPMLDSNHVQITHYTNIIVNHYYFQHTEKKYIQKLALIWVLPLLSSFKDSPTIHYTQFHISHIKPTTKQDTSDM